MAKELFAKSGNKVIPFEQNGQFYHRKAKKHMDNNNYLNALSMYRKAVEKEPKNIEYMLDLAEAFTEMGCFDQSSRVLFSILHKEKERVDCYFGLGCNFLGMQEYDKAADCFEKYLDVEPYGIYSEEARDLLDVLEDYDIYDDEEPYTLEEEKDLLYDLATEGKDLLDGGEYGVAINKLKRASELAPELSFIKNNLALAYFCNGDIEEAIEVSLDVLDIDPFNIHANCNLCLFINERDGEEGSRKYLDRILSFQAQDPEEIHKIAVTLCELGEHAEANVLLRQLLRFRPYDIYILHYVAVSYFNQGQYGKAYKYWIRISKIDPDNNVSAYYMRLALSHMRNHKEHREISYHFQVPYDEILRRIKELNSILKLDEDELTDRWKKDDNFRSLLNWGLGLNDDLIKRSILNVVASFGDDKAEEFLREFLLRIDEETELKTEALGLLKQMEADEPYITYADEGIVQVKVDIWGDGQFEIPEEMEGVLAVALDRMDGRYEIGYWEVVEKIWADFIEQLYPDHLPRIRKDEAWAAAVELYYCYDQDIPVKKGDIVSIYDITYTALNNNFKKLMDVLDS